MYKTALVTGAARRIGRSIAQFLAHRGMRIVVHYHGSQTEAMETVDQIVANGGWATAIAADLLCQSACQNLIEKSNKVLAQPVDMLINNASVFEYDTLLTATELSWHRHINSNLRAPFILTQNFAKQAQFNSKATSLARGCIINIIDQRVRKLTPEFFTYTLAKTGLWTLTQTSAQALAPQIRVNAIAPGTTLKAARQTEAHFNAQRANSILKRGANIDDILITLDYFIHSPAVSGQLICVDGGQSLTWQSPDIINTKK